MTEPVQNQPQDLLAARARCLPLGTGTGRDATSLARLRDLAALL